MTIGSSVETVEWTTLFINWMPESIVAFSQDLEASEPPIFAEVGLIVLPEITRRAMEAAVGFLAPRGFFERFRPLEENERIW